LDAEQILPVSYLIFNAQWRYKGYSVMVKERPALADGLIWKKTCIFCHNTAPHLSTVLDELYGERAPSFQGSASVEMPEARRFRYEVQDANALERALLDEQKYLGNSGNAHATGRELIASAINLTSEAFDESALVEVGIGCEACHNGAREHAKNPALLPSFRLESTAFEVRTAKGEMPSHAEEVNRTCTKCHTVLFSRYPYTWEGGLRSHNPGGSNINSGEGRDFMLGGCATELSCATCHDPHASDSRALVERLETPAGNTVCTTCHAQYRGNKLSAHTHHAAGSTGSVCINCHMPKKNMGLSYQLTRYHRIGSPTDAARVEHDRPLECALCHADKTVDQLVKTMERFWGKRYDRNALSALYGRDLRINVVTATLLAGKPHEKAVAATLAGELRFERSVPLLISELDNPYPLVRFYVKNALEQIVGEKIPLDMHASGKDIVSAADQWFKARAASSPAARHVP
jgi:predicted CXXCH cytochrome family protein